MEILKVEGEDILFIRDLGVFNYSADSKLAGQKYHRFVYGGKVFTVNHNDPFIEDLNNGRVTTIQLVKNGEFLEFTGHITLKRKVGFINSSKVLAALESQAVSEVDFASLIG